MSEPGEAGDYYRAVEEEFLRRRGAPLLLSPRDWALIGDWQAAGIPLRIVLQGIANVFDAFERRPPTARRINSLSYCRQEVLGLHELYRSLRGIDAGRPSSAGGGAGEGARAVGRHLGRLLRRMRESMSLASEAGLEPLVAGLARVSADMKLLRRQAKTGALDPQALEAGLRRLDEALLDSARRSLPPEETRSAEEEAGRTLAAESARMTPEAFATTRRALLARRLRLRLRLPRLTLFD